MEAAKLLPAGWVLALILTSGLLLALFGDGEVVSSQVEVENSDAKNKVPIGPLGGPVCNTNTNLITNGTFTTDLSGWTAVGNVFPFSQFANFNGGDNPPNGVLSQAIQTIPNRTYRLTYTVGRFTTGGVGDQSLLVQATDGAAVLASKTTNAPAPGGQNINDSLVFVATGTSTTISFTDTSVVTIGTDVALDNVVVNVGSCAAAGGIFGPALWVKANGNLQANGSNQVSQWIDESGSFNTLSELRASSPTHTDPIVASAGILRVANGINFNPAVDFTGAVGRSLKGNAASGWNTSPVSIFSVALPEGPTLGAFGGVFTTNGNWITTTTAVGPGVNVSGSAASYTLDGAGCLPAPTTSSINEPRVIRGIYTTGNNALGGSTWLNGVLEATAANCANGGGAFFEVGGRTGGTSSLDNRIFNGKIAEVVVYKSVLPAADANKIESYLAVKYGITLRQTPSAQNYVASDGTVFWNSAANTIYNKNIAGIGQDDTSGLNQKQSRSVNLPASGNMVTMGLGTIATDNASNTNTFGANLNFLTWGDDGAGAGFTTLITPPAGILATVRTTRIWKTQETGTVGPVKVGIPANLGGGNVVYLVVSNDTTFDASDQYFPMTPLTVGSTTYQATDFDFTTGQFFTFATLPGIPGGVATPVTWEKANDGAPSGALWDDSSASGNDATQSILVSQPTLVIGSDPSAVNFNPAFTFDGVDDFQDYPNNLDIGGTADFSSAVVFRPAVSGSTHVLFGGVSAAAVQYDFMLNASNQFGTFVGGGGGVCDSNTTTALPVNVPGIGSSVRASSNISVQLNGGGTGSGTCTANFNTDIRRLGAGNGNFSSGTIPEFIHYNRALSANELQRVHSYLAVKYGITLDQTAPTDYLTSDSTVIWNATANAVYNKDIAGIGRDDVSALNQKQSASANAGNFLIIGHGSIAADNETNPNEFSANKDFLIWGHDGGPTAFVVPIAGTPLMRMTRIWKAQENAVDNVVVRVPQSLFANVLPTLVRSTDSTFDSTDTLVPMTLNGTNYEATIDLNNGDFFTFAQSILTAANVSISGRVLTAQGRGIRNASVILTDQHGVSRTVAASARGNYRFDDVEAGQTYILSVFSRRYQFEPRVLNVNDNITDVDFIAQE